MRTPNLDKLFAFDASAVDAQLSTSFWRSSERDWNRRRHRKHYNKRQISTTYRLRSGTVSTIVSTVKCRYCDGAGIRDTRRHIAPKACGPCAGKGYYWFDAKPGPAAAPSYEMPEAPVAERVWKNQRIVRTMPALAVEVGENWCSRKALEWRNSNDLGFSLAPLYPLTYAGQKMNETRDLSFGPLAEGQALALLSWAEKCAAAAVQTYSGPIQ